MDTSCRYANQDKSWVRDPDGVEWEVYHLNYDVDEEASSAAGSTCRTPLAKDQARSRVQAALMA